MYNYDTELSRFFTDFEPLRQTFHKQLISPILVKRILLIHGVGGIGKTSLLRMYRLTCKSEKVPVALVSGDDTKSALEVLARWSSDLKEDKIFLPSFDKAYGHYHDIQLKIDKQLQKTKTMYEQALDVASKAVSKTAEAAGGAVLGATIGSLLPGIGTVIGSAFGGVLGGAGTEAVMEWLRGFLSKPDIDFLLNPTQELTQYFLTDAARTAINKRLVLIFDTYEHALALEDWIREFAQRLHANIFLVIAGRTIPNWNRAWPGWMIHSQIEEVKPMTEKAMRALIRNYYSTIHGGVPDPEQVGAIIHFARGLPMVVTSAVKLWAQYGIGDFQSIKPQVMVDLVDRLLEGIPSGIIPLMKAAATVRWFDQPILRTLTGRENVENAFDEIRRFPFVRSRTEGLMFHDAVREIIDDNLRIQDPQRHNDYHRRAAVYFDQQLSNSNSIPGFNTDWQKFALEKSYHLLLSDELAGADFLHVAFEHGLVYFRYQFCKQLLNDAKSLNVSNKKVLHRIRFNEIRLTMAEFSPAYVNIQEFKQVVDQCDADVTTKWQVLLSYANFLGFTTAQPKLQAEYSLRSLAALRDIKQEETRVGCLVLKEVAACYYEEPLIAETMLTQALRISEKIQEPFYAYEPYIELGHLYLAQGYYGKAENMWKAAITIAEAFQNDSLIANAFNRLAHTYMAQERLTDAEQALTSALQAAMRLPDTLGAGKDKIMYIKRHFGMLYQMKEEYSKAIKYYSESAETYRERKSLGGRSRTLVLLAGCLYEAGLDNDLHALLPEMIELMPKVGIQEVLASWHIIQGHIAIDDVVSNNAPVRNAVELYKKALEISLGSIVTVSDEILNRIFWKLGLIDSQNHELVIFIINALKDYWINEKKQEKSLHELDTDKRKKFFVQGSKEQPYSHILDELNFALINGVPARRMMPWWAY